MVQFSTYTNFIGSILKHIIIKYTAWLHCKFLMIKNATAWDDLPVFQFHFAQIVHFDYLQKQHRLDEEMYAL